MLLSGGKLSNFCPVVSFLASSYLGESLSSENPSTASNRHRHKTPFSKGSGLAQEVYLRISETDHSVLPRVRYTTISRTSAP